MKTITIFLWCLAGLVLGTVTALGQNPTPIANLRRATTVYPTNVIPVVTNPGQTNGTEGVTLDSVLASMLTFPGWPSGVSVTNAVGVIKLDGSTVTAAANAIDFITGSNVVVRATNTTGTVTVQINGAAPMNTNLQVQSVKVFGQQTNAGDIIISGGAYPKVQITSLTAPAVMTLDTGGLTTSAQNNQPAISIEPQGVVSATFGTNYWIPGFTGFALGAPGYAFNTGYFGLLIATNLRPSDVGASALVRTDSGTNLAAVTVGSGLTFDGTTLSVSSGGSGGGGPASYAVLPASGIIGGTQYGYVTNLSANQMLIVSNLTADIHYFVEVKSAGFVASISNYQAIFFMAEQQGGVSALSTNGVSALEVWKDSVSGRTNAMLHGPEFTMAADPGISFSTNNLTRVLTLRQDWSVSASVTNVVGVSNYVGSVSNLAQTKQLGSANLTNWSNIPTGAMANVSSTTFLTNWANAISNLVGTASGTGTNFNGTVTTNLSRYIVTHYGDSTNITVPVNSTNSFDWYPASNSAMALSGSFVADQAQTILATIALTNTSITSLVLPVADANGQPIVLKTPPSTNLLAIRWDGTRMWGESGLSGLNTNQFSSDGSAIKSGAQLTNAQLRATGGGSAIGRGLYQWDDGTITIAKLYDDFEAIFTSFVDPEGVDLHYPNGATISHSPTAAISTSSRLGGRGGIANLRTFNTNISSYASVWYGGTTIALPTLLATTNIAFYCNSGFDNSYTPLTNCPVLMGSFNRLDTTAPTSGIGWTYDSLVNSSWGCFAVNNGVASGTNWVGPLNTVASNALVRFGWELSMAGPSITFTTNGVAALTITSTTTIPTNTALLHGVRLGTSVTNIGTVNYVLCVDKLEVYEK